MVDLPRGPDGRRKLRSPAILERALGKRRASRSKDATKAEKAASAEAKGLFGAPKAAKQNPQAAMKAETKRSAAESALDASGPGGARPLGDAQAVQERVPMQCLADLVAEKAILLDVKASGRKQVIQSVADKLAEATGLDARAIYEAVMERERVSGTGVGEGVAIPHARMAGLKAPVLGFARLDPPIDFEGLDGRPADLVFVLLAPQSAGADHLRALARVSRFLRRSQTREQLRSARGLEGVKTVLCPEAEPQIA